MIGSVRLRRYTTRTAALRASGTTAPRGAVPANPQLFPERQAMEISNNILVKIKLGYNQFTRTERKIADYVLANSKDVPFMSITELSDACHVAEASVHRFCRTIKVKGYQEFKMMLSLSVKEEDDRSRKLRESTGFSESDAGKRQYQQILEYHLDAIRETNALLNPAVVNETVEMMTSARRIMFLGVGNSMITAEEAQGRFLHITPKVCYVIDPHMQAMAASMVGPDDMLIFFSYSGATKDNVMIAKIARERGAKITVITRYLKSDLTRYADTVFICGAKEGPLEGGSMGAKMSQLHIIDILFQCYYHRNEAESRRNNELTAAANLDRYDK